jgi:hypothetical protein
MVAGTRKEKVCSSTQGARTFRDGSFPIRTVLETVLSVAGLGMTLALAAVLR